MIPSSHPLRQWSHLIAPWLLAACAGGCAHVSSVVIRAPLPVPPDIAAYYDYPRRPIAPAVGSILGTTVEYVIRNAPGRVWVFTGNH